ncbi:MAG: transglutaminase family protein [Candidatus Shapirobacteria bacterium]
MFSRLAFFIYCFLFLFSTTSFAISDFTINENIEYLINNSGQATVTHLINITNNYSQIYPNEYQIQIQGLPLSDLSATDSEGNILSSFITQNETSVIKLKFNHPKVGKNQTTSIKLIYRISELAKHKGKTWEITLPQLTDKALNNTQITIKTPSDFGSLSFASIPAKFQDGLTQNITTFQNNSHAKILIILGDYQLFDFKLNYTLKNPSTNTIISEIALIPDTYSQSVFYQSISPPPVSISIDPDGNWLAKYQLSDKEQLNITAIGQVKTGLHIPIELTDKNQYLQSQTFWPVSDPQIQDISKSLSSTRSIYDYVVNTLNYNYERINSSGRLGAIAAIIDPNNSLCTEFTDLFVTLARAKGIPAREIEGYAYSNNPKIKPTNLQSDVLHAWPEYYNSATKTWKAIDPTWGKTTNGIDYFNDLDLNHITFVTHGLNSQNPLPPGSYKNDIGEKSIFIDFASEEIKRETSLPIISFKGNRLLIQNTSPNSQKNLKLSGSDPLFNKNIDTILPYSSIYVDIPQISFWQSLSSKHQKITYTLKNSDEQISTQTLNYTQHFVNLGISIVVGLVILATSGIIITSLTHEKNT